MCFSDSRTRCCCDLGCQTIILHHFKCCCWATGTARDIVFGTDRLASTTMLVSTLLLAPLLEEIVYRAVLLEGLSAKLPKLPSVLLSIIT